MVKGRIVGKWLRPRRLQAVEIAQSDRQTLKKSLAPALFASQLPTRRASCRRQQRSTPPRQGVLWGPKIAFRRRSADNARPCMQQRAPLAHPPAPTRRDRR